MFSSLNYVFYGVLLICNKFPVQYCQCGWFAETIDIIGQCASTLILWSQFILCIIVSRL